MAVSYTHLDVYKRQGHGDPSLEAKHYPRRKGIFYDQVYLALQQAGIRQIRGRIVVDASAYCDEGYLEAWPREDWGRRYAPAVYGAVSYTHLRRGFCSKGGLDDDAKERNFNNGIIGYSKRLEL